MATSHSGGGGEEELKKMAELSKTLKEGEKLLAPSRRPDGTLRKPIRIRAGYVPQDEVAKYQSKGALWRKEMEAQVVPPGYDPAALDAKPKTKSAKRNERKKEKRLQAAVEKEKNLEADIDIGEEGQESADNPVDESGSVQSLTSQMQELAVSMNSVAATPANDASESLDPGAPSQDIDKRIRALKKKIRLAEAQQQKIAAEDMKPEQLEKMAKLEDWRQELQLLEAKKAEQQAAS